MAVAPTPLEASTVVGPGTGTVKPGAPLGVTLGSAEPSRQRSGDSERGDGGGGGGGAPPVEASVDEDPSLAAGHRGGGSAGVQATSGGGQGLR